MLFSGTSVEYTTTLKLTILILEFLVSKSNFIVKKVDPFDPGGVELLIKYHYLHRNGKVNRCPLIAAYGLYHTDSPNEILGFCTYGNPVSPTIEASLFKDGRRYGARDGALELRRVVMRPDVQTSEHNITSWFVSRTMRLLSKTRTCDYILSYASTGLHQGTIYKALNFKFYGLASPGSYYYYVSKTGKAATFKQTKRLTDHTKNNSIYFYKCRDFRKMRFIYWVNRDLERKCVWEEVTWSPDYEIDLIEKDKLNVLKNNDPIVYYYDFDKDTTTMVARYSELS